MVPWPVIPQQYFKLEYCSVITAAQQNDASDYESGWYNNISNQNITGRI